jgi:MinD superfamily P-loop ATPase
MSRAPSHTTTRARATPRVNLRRLTECSLCERLTPVRGNAKLYGDERDAVALCERCAASCRAHAAVERERRIQEEQR